MKMSIWAWLAIGIGAFAGAALVVGLLIARILGNIGRDVTCLLETEMWSAAPLTRALEAPPEVPASTPTADRESLRRSE
jgi:hypothetical protein